MSNNETRTAEGPRREVIRKLPTIESVYGKPLEQLKPPERWEFSGEFRVPSEGELFLSSLDHTPCAMGPRPTPNEPRLILRRVEQPTIESIYGAPRASLRPPAGWTLGEFREPKFGERFLSRKRLLPTRYDGGTWTGGPRLILEPVKADAPKRRRWVFEETGETRNPKAGEWVFEQNGLGAVVIWNALVDIQTGRPSRILCLVEKPEC